MQVSLPAKTFTMFANKEKKFVEETILKNEFPS